MIPILDLTRQYQTLKAALEPRVLEVLASGGYILGPTVEKFEAEMAQYLGAKHALGVASGTDALYLAMRALDIGEGDEVITTPFSYIATSEAIARCGATPVFIDIDADTFNMDLSLIEAAITPKTKAILPVHLYGQAVDMTQLMAIAQAYNLYVVEDCAQSIGSQWQQQKTGNIGHIGCYSFFPTKNLGAAGDGGLVSTNDQALAERMKRLRVHGAQTRYYHDMEGINSRLDALQAAILAIKLPYIDQWNARRKEIATYYTQQFQQQGAGVIQPPQAPKDTQSHVYHQYTLRLKGVNRDQVQQLLLEQHQVQSMIYYPLPLHLQGMHANLGYQKGAFPVCEQVADEVLSLPIFPELTQTEMETVVNAVITVCQQQKVAVSAVG